MRLFIKLKSPKILLLALFFSMLSTGIIGAQSSFKDINENHDYFDAIDYFKNRGDITGYDNGFFLPQKNINRAEFLKMLLEIGNVEVELIFNCFLDVSNEWFAPYICTAQKKGYVEGYKNGNFLPDKYISLAEAIKIIFRVFELDENKLHPLQRWYDPFLITLSEKNAIPITDTKIHDPVKRGEIMEMLYRVTMEIKSRSSREFKPFSDALYISKNNLKKGYSIHNNTVYYYEYGKDPYINGSSFLVEGFDIDSFQILNEFYAKDKNNVFHRGKKVSFVDPHSFEVLLYDFAYDNVSLYMCGKQLNIEKDIFDNIAPYQYPYAKKNNTEIVFIKGCMDKIFEGSKPKIYTVLEGVSLDKFQVLSYPYAKHANDFYYEALKIEGVDLTSFDPVKFDDRNITKVGESYIYQESEDEKNQQNYSEQELSNPEIYINKRYSIKNNEIYTSNRKLEGVDINSFQPLEYDFSKDKESIFYNYNKLKNVDYETFKAVGYDIYSDKNGFYVFFVSEWEFIEPEVFKNYGFAYYGDKNRIISIANREVFNITDVESFECWSYEYCKDKNHVYHSGVKVDTFYAPTLRVIDNDNEYFSDSISVYYGFHRLEGANANNFKILGNDYSTSGKRAYWRDVIIEKADAISLEVISKDYARDALHVFHKGEVMEFADPVTFQVLENHFARDKDNVYLGNSIIENADYYSFRPIKHYWLSDPDDKGGYSRDNSSVYRGNLKISQYDPNTFNHLYYAYTADKNGIYFDDKRIIEVDRDSFNVDSFYPYIIFSKDKNYSYVSGERMHASYPEGGIYYVDLDSFRRISDHYCYDKKYVFFSEEEDCFSKLKIVDGAKTETFNVLFHPQNFVLKTSTPNMFTPKYEENLHFYRGEIYGADEKYVYYQNKKIEGSDPESFELDEKYAGVGRDKNNEYHYGEVYIDPF